MVTWGKKRKKKRSAEHAVLDLRRWQKYSIWNYSAGREKITSVDCLRSQLYHRTLMLVSLIKKKKKKREKEKEKGSCNCSNVCKRTRNLDPIWHPSQHVFLSRALGSNVNRKKTASALCCEFFTQEGKRKIGTSMDPYRMCDLCLRGVCKWGIKSSFSYSVRLLPHWPTDSVVLDLPQRYLTNISS